MEVTSAGREREQLSEEVRWQEEVEERLPGDLAEHYHAEDGREAASAACSSR